MQRRERLPERGPADRGGGQRGERAEEGLRLVDEAVGAGLAEQTAVLSVLDAEQAGRPADLLRELLLATEGGPDGA
ncbi:hypothetical protein ACFOOM_06130 [Streptomyces echinoruber]|uniref:Uncharacterized protein n=1 Tax=Streptomyces echinoruber TaxID=68898 RepID=A0A918QZ21_9ACTN|nr:hypothetical protein GCM10010389_14680 [Streptomyces echinoruber]